MDGSRGGALGRDLDHVPEMVRQVEAAPCPPVYRFISARWTAVCCSPRRGEVEARADAAHPHPGHLQRQDDQSQLPVSTALRVAVPDPAHESFLRFRAIKAIVANRCSVHGWTAAG